MTAFLRYSQRKDLQYYAPDLTGAARDGNGHIHVIDQNAAIGYTWTVTPPLSSRLAWASPISWPARRRRIWADRAWLPCSAVSKACRPHPASPAESIPKHQWTHCLRPPNQQSAVPESNVLGSGTQLFENRRPAFHQGGLPIPAIRTEILDTNPIYGQDTYSGYSASPPAASWASLPAARSRLTIPVTASRISCSALPTGQPGKLFGHQSAAIRALDVLSGRLPGERQAYAQRRLRWEFASRSMSAITTIRISTPPATP